MMQDSDEDHYMPSSVMPPQSIPRPDPELDSGQPIEEASLADEKEPDSEMVSVDVNINHERMQEIATTWREIAGKSVAFKEQLGEDTVAIYLGDERCSGISPLLPALVEEAVILAVREMADTAAAHKQPYERVDPFVQILGILYEGVVPSMCRSIVRDAVTEIVEDVLLSKRCRIALEGLEEECLSEILYTSDVFECALEEEDESQAVEGVLEEGVGDMLKETATEVLFSFEKEAHQVHSGFQRSVVNKIAQLVIGRRVAVGHLMMSISNHFSAVLLEYHTTNAAFRLAIERILLYLYAIEEKVDMVADSAMPEHAFIEVAIPTVQDELVKQIVSLSRELEDKIDDIEDQYDECCASIY